MAEKFADIWLKNSSIADRNEYVVQSRALSDLYDPPGSPASLHGATILSTTYGIDLSWHRSTLISIDDIVRAYKVR